MSISSAFSGKDVRTAYLTTRFSTSIEPDVYIGMSVANLGVEHFCGHSLAKQQEGEVQRTRGTLVQAHCTLALVPRLPWTVPTIRIDGPRQESVRVETRRNIDEP